MGWPRVRVDQGPYVTHEIGPWSCNLSIRYLWPWTVTDALHHLQVPARPQEAVSTPARRTSTPLPMLTPLKVRLKGLSEGLMLGLPSVCLARLSGDGPSPALRRGGGGCANAALQDLEVGMSSGVLAGSWKRYGVGLACSRSGLD